MCEFSLDRSKFKFQLGDRVMKIRGSSWRGRVVGMYSTELNPEGYVVESEYEKGSVQVYPATALELIAKWVSGKSKERPASK